MTASLPPRGDRALAPAWRRIAARFIDAATVLTLLWTLVVVRALWFMSGLSDRFQPAPWGRSFVPAVSFVVLALVYETVFLTYNKGQTPGKDVMNLRVIGPDAGEVAPGRAFVRGLPVLVTLVRPAWAAAALVGIAAMTILPGRRRTLVDAVAGTVVVRYQRDIEDPSARSPVSRHQRRAAAGTTRTGTRGPR